MKGKERVYFSKVFKSSSRQIGRLGDADAIFESSEEAGGYLRKVSAATAMDHQGSEV